MTISSFCLFEKPRKPPGLEGFEIKPFCGIAVSDFGGHTMESMLSQMVNRRLVGCLCCQESAGDQFDPVRTVSSQLMLNRSVQANNE